MRRWRPMNVPIPRVHVLALLSGFALQAMVPRRLLRRARIGRVIGWLFVAVGTTLAARAVRAAGTVDVSDPDVLVTRGPYARSRNPMYVAWTGIYVGVALVRNTAWPIVLLPAVVFWTHVTVLAEECELERAFGAEYRTYRERVPRYR